MLSSRLLVLVLLWLFIAASPVFAVEVPYLAGRVNDLAELLSPSTVSELEQLLKAHEDSTSNQVAVLTIVSLEGEVLEEYSMKVAETWKLGAAAKDNGAILLVVRDERMVRIEVGSGLEGDLTDAISGLIIRRQIVPRFRDGDYDGGIRDGVVAILAAISGSYSADEDSPESGDLAGRLVGFGLFIIVVGLFSVVAVVSSGCTSWGLFAFLIPFWLVFPSGLLGMSVGIPMFVAYVVLFFSAKLWFLRSGKRKMLSKKWSSGGGFGSLAAGGWSSRGGSFSSGGFSSGGGFSGGGGGFSGGGASGRW